MAALRSSLSLVLAILTAYYYALLTKTLTTLKRLRTAVLDIIFWETWGLNGKILRRIPGPWALPVIGAQWLYYPLLGKYKYSKYHEANDEKLEQYGTVVREEVIWNFPLIHLFDSKVRHRNCPSTPLPVPSPPSQRGRCLLQELSAQLLQRHRNGE